MSNRFATPLCAIWILNAGFDSRGSLARAVHAEHATRRTFKSGCATAKLAHPMPGSFSEV